VTVARILLGALLLLSVGASSVQAQVSAEVAAARQEALAGNFEPASAALDAALGRSDLTREDLLTIYEAEVFIDFANGDSAAVRDNLVRIAALDPDHAFDANYFPADVSDVFRDIVSDRDGALAIEAEAVVLASGEFEVRGRVRNDPGLSEDVRVFGRGAGGEWASGSGTLRVAPEGAKRGEFYAEAVGPGGAILARDGQEASPLSVDLAVATADEGGGVPVWVWIVGGVVLAGIAVTIIAVAATSGGVSDDTQPTGPMVRF
jgi:hypothetical protein